MPSPTYSYGGGGSNNASAQVVTLPGAAAARPVLIILNAQTTSITFSQTSGTTGWTELATANGVSVWRKDVGASESNPSFDLSATDDVSFHVWRFIANIDGWATTLPKISSQGSTENPPSVTISPTDTGLAIAWTGNDDARDDVTGAPSTYANLQTQSGGSGPDSTESGSADKYITPAASSEDPGAFTVDSGGTWRSYTLFIHEGTEFVPATLEQIHFRMRPTGADPAINADTGADWAFAEDTSGTLALLDEYPLSVRIRFQIQAVGGDETAAYELWYDKDAAASYSLIPNQSAPWTTGVTQNEVMLVPSLTFSEAAATTRLLTTGTFVAGEGRHSEPTGSIALTEDDITEIEFVVLIRKWSGDGHVPDASTFDFRVRRSDGTVLDTYDVTPRVTIGNKPGHIGGTMPESPANMLITEDTGVLYTFIEAHDQNSGTVGDELVVMMSTDGGVTWTAPDFANRPGSAFNDIEAIDVQYIAANDRIYIVWQETTNVRYVEFNTSGHASPNEYGTTETVDAAVTATVFGQQGVAFRRRLSDGVGWIAYQDNDGTDDRVSLKKRTSGGTWDGSPTDLDGEASQHVTGAVMEIDSSNIIHILYMVLRGTSTDADLYHRSINTSETLSGRTAANDAGTDMEGASPTKVMPHTPPRIYNDGGTEKIGVAFIDNALDPMFTDSPVGTIAFVTDEAISTTNVATSAGGSGQVQMALMWDDVDDVPIVLFTDEGDESLLKTVTRPVSTWTGEATELDLTNDIGWLRGRVFTHSSGNGGDRVIGYIYDEHLNPGGTGGVAYREIVRAAGAVAPVLRRRQRTTVRL